MKIEDYVIFDPKTGKYFYRSNAYGMSPWETGDILKADGFNCPDRAQSFIDGLILPSGRVGLEAVPEMKDCVVKKRIIIAIAE